MFFCIIIEVQSLEETVEQLQNKMDNKMEKINLAMVEERISFNEKIIDVRRASTQDSNEVKQQMSQFEKKLKGYLI